MTFIRKKSNIYQLNMAYLQSVKRIKNKNWHLNDFQMSAAGFSKFFIFYFFL